MERCFDLFAEQLREIDGFLLHSRSLARFVCSLIYTLRKFCLAAPDSGGCSSANRKNQHKKRKRVNDAHFGWKLNEQIYMYIHIYPCPYAYCCCCAACVVAIVAKLLQCVRLRLLQLIKNYCIRRKVHKNIEHKRNRHPLHFAPPPRHNTLQCQQQQQQRRQATSRHCNKSVMQPVAGVAAKISV